MCTNCQQVSWILERLYCYSAPPFVGQEKTQLLQDWTEVGIFPPTYEDFDDNLFAVVSKESHFFSSNLRRGKNSFRSCSSVNQTRFKLIFWNLQPCIIQHASNWSCIVNGIFLKNPTNQLLEDSTEFIEHKRNHEDICLEACQIWLKHTSHKWKEMQLCRNERIRVGWIKFFSLVDKFG